MKNRILALVCCLSLALGCVAYRPPEAKAVAGVDDLFVSLFVSFTSSAGLSYVSNSLDAPSLVDAFAPYLREFEEAKNETISHWMGYDSYDDWLSDLRMHIDTDGKAQLFIPRPMAEKLNSFATWFREKLWIVSGSKNVPIYSFGMSWKLADGSLLQVGPPDESATHLKFGEKYYFANGCYLYCTIESSSSFIVGLYSSSGTKLAGSNCSDGSGRAKYFVDYVISYRADRDQITFGPHYVYGNLGDSNYKELYLSYWGDKSLSTWVNALSAPTSSKGLAVSQPSDVSAPISDDDTKVAFLYSLVFYHVFS